MSAKKSDPIALMYTALLQISCVSAIHLGIDALERAKEIADKALQEMNVEHTRKVQKALGIGATR